jgi:hypothetical protein
LAGPSRLPAWALAHGKAAAGLLPGAALGAALGATSDAPSIPPVVIRVSVWREAEATAGQAGARFDLVTAGVALCPQVWHGGAIDAAVCGGGEAGRVRASGFGFDRSQETTTTMGHVLLEPRGAIRMGPGLVVEAGLGLQVPVVRPRFTFDQGGIAVLLYQAPMLALVGHAGLGLRF